MSFAASALAFLAALAAKLPQRDEATVRAGDATRQDMIALEVQVRDLTRDLDASYEDAKAARAARAKAETRLAVAETELHATRLELDQARLDLDQARRTISDAMRFAPIGPMAVDQGHAHRGAGQRSVEEMLAIPIFRETYLAGAPRALMEEVVGLPPNPIAPGDFDHLSQRVRVPPGGAVEIDPAALQRPGLLSWCNCVPARHDMFLGVTGTRPDRIIMDDPNAA